MFKLKSRFQKYYNKKNILLCIDRIKITKNIIFDIINSLDYKNLIIITDLDKGNKLFSYFEERNIRHDVFTLGSNNDYVETILLLSNKEIDILNMIVNEKVEEIYIFNDEGLYNWKTKINYDEYTIWKQKCHPELCIEFIFKENEINILYNPELYSNLEDTINLLSKKNKDLERGL